MRAFAPIVAAAILITSSAARASEPAPAPEPLPAFDETPFGPRYVIEDVRVSGNRKTERSLIVGELGAVGLVVNVEERGTLVINEIFAATSPATAFWGGVDLAETNFLGRGINLGAGFVASTKPIVPDAHAGVGLRLHVGVPPLGGPTGVALSITGLFNDGSEFYRASGADDDDDAGRFVATRVRRIGGVLTAGLMLPVNFHASVAFRQ